MAKIRTIYTIGHSTLPYRSFADLILKNQITLLIDIRSLPGSSFVQQYNKGKLSAALKRDGIKYLWLKKLGGRRYGFGKKSPNICWRNRSFRGYADYMMTKEFQEGIDALLKKTKGEIPVIMCAEALYWRCHRNLVSDFLKSKKMRIMHIMSNGKLVAHKYTGCAKIVKGRLRYY